MANGSGTRCGRPTLVVLFGGNGDLAARRILPGLFALFQMKLMPERFEILGNARRPLSDEEFRAFTRKALDASAHKYSDEEWEQFSQRLHFHSSDFAPGQSEDLGGAIRELLKDLGEDAEILYYLSTPPTTFERITQAIGEQKLAEQARVVFEKPFGTSLASFCELDAAVHRVFDESQIFRIDHFLGKESVQNIHTIRFANGLFEGIWNRHYIDSVQIDVPEDLDVGKRAGFYDGTGAFLDMIVTHLFHVLAEVAMEPPTSLTAEDLAVERRKVFEAMRPLEPEDVVLGQYEGYRETEGVAPDSTTDTFVAAKVWVDNWRWDGVPFFLRTGKNMALSAQLVTVTFRAAPARLLGAAAPEGLAPNHLSFRLSGQEGMSLSLIAKRPGPDYQLATTQVGLQLSEAFPEEGLQAYERLLHDALLGNRALFTRPDGLARVWELAAPLLDHKPPAIPYPKGSMGPKEADELIAPRKWVLQG
jgi:glucose-6-phosphate 1-dehydrogenase